MLRHILIIVNEVFHSLNLSDECRVSQTTFKEALSEGASWPSVDMLLIDARGGIPSALPESFFPGVPTLFLFSKPEDLRGNAFIAPDGRVTLLLREPVSEAELTGHISRMLAAPQANTASVPVWSPEAASLKGKSDAERMQVFRLKFAKRLEGRLRDLAQAIETAQLAPSDLPIREDARRLAHSLKGAALTFGFPELGAEAKLMEGLFAAGEMPQWTEIDQSFERLQKLRPQVEQNPTPSYPTNSWIASVLVVDRDKSFLRQLEQIGRETLINVVPCASAAEAMRKAGDASLDGVIIDAHLGSGGPADESAHGLARQLRANPSCELLPIAVISDEALGAIDERITAQHSGASLFLTKPLDAGTFGEAARLLASLRRAGRPKILVVDDDADFTEYIVSMLTAEGMVVNTLHEPAAILESLEAIRPELLLLDVTLPTLNGFDICRMLRMTPKWRDLPIVFLTARAGSVPRIVAFQAGGDDYLTKPFLKEELISRIRLRVERRRMLREKMDHDVLTGLRSRGPFVDALKSHLIAARANNIPVAVCILDLDYFKRVNDTYGHGAGDRVLAGFGNLLSCRLRSDDLRARWGGEEFALAIVGDEAATAKETVRRLLQEFSAMQFEGDNGELFSVSFSAGIAQVPQDASEVQDLLMRADARLMEAKNAGRNCVAAA